jgi:hypothetical protein
MVAKLFTTATPYILAELFTAAKLYIVFFLVFQ